MPQGRVKVFDEERNFGFVQPLEGGFDVYVHRSELGEVESLRVGDIVEYEIGEGDDGPVAREVKVTERAPDELPTGRVVAGGPPPTWDQLEDIERQKRDARRQKRRRR